MFARGLRRLCSAQQVTLAASPKRRPSGTRTPSPCAANYHAFAFPNPSGTQPCPTRYVLAARCFLGFGGERYGEHIARRRAQRLQICLAAPKFLHSPSGRVPDWQVHPFQSLAPFIYYRTIEQWYAHNLNSPPPIRRPVRRVLHHRRALRGAEAYRECFSLVQGPQCVLKEGAAAREWGSRKVMRKVR